MCTFALAHRTVARRTHRRTIAPLAPSHYLPVWAVRARFQARHNRPMLTDFSNQLADAAAAAAPSVVQVQGRRRAASGVVYAPGVIVTTVQALGREDGLHVRGNEGDAERTAVDFLHALYPNLGRHLPG